MNIMDKSQIIIKNFWKKYSSIIQLRKVYNCFEKLNLQELANMCTSINEKIKGDGCGLSGGVLTDMLITEILYRDINDYKEFRNGENDMNLCGINFSFKKITGKSTIALDWSKNKCIKNKSKFTSHIIILNLKTEKWWIKESQLESGFYFIDRKYCKKYIKLTSNNKTDTLISNKELYKMLLRASSQKLYIKIPEPNNKIKFNILNAFK
jgi:hypothetical protein